MTQFMFRDPQGGRELVLPVSPKGYEIEHGRKITSVVLQTVGEVNLPGPDILFNKPLSCLLPANPYPFLTPGAGTNPWVYLEQLQRWSDAGTVLRFVISDCPVNAPVLLGPIVYQEQDGSGDLYCTIPLRRYRELKLVEMQATSTAVSRTVEALPEKGGTYTVQQGDTLSAICRKIYGDAGLYGRLAAANGIKNPNLIYPGQVLKLPDKGRLPAAAKPSASRAVAEATTVEVDLRQGKDKATILKEKVREILHKGGFSLGGTGLPSAPAGNGPRG